MATLKHTTIFLMLVVGIAAVTASAKSPSALLQEALYAEEVEGNLDTAIKTYQQIIDDPTAQRSHLAQAIYRQGMCYLKLKNELQASQNFQKLVSQFSDQTDIIKKVQPMLEDIINRDPADLMPPETLAYVEFGSPGKQIETILNLLKGTPFENPLAAIPGPRGHVGPGGASPDQILASLLNPSMLAEFKKIRGMAVGVTDIRHDNPPMVAVLYPGKSDALRGIILALLGIVAKPGEPIEGMTSLIIEDTTGVVYDDNVIILAQSLEQLTWCVKQHLGLTNNPTLASSNKSFAKISKKARNENLMTLWANVDELYTGLLKQFPADDIPKEILWANAIADFGSIDDLITYMSINDIGLTSETNITFKDGHKCLVYDMIRTPNLTKAGLEAVPPEAIGLISFALGQPDGAQAKAVSQRLQNVTGLDIGREIFANIEQLTLFAVPCEESKGEDLHQQLPASLGLAITSHDPQQTRQILTTILGTVNLVVGDQEAGPTDASAGRYQIGLVNDQRLYCYMDQANKTTVLSLNRDITDAAIAAVKKRKSVCNDGVLKDAVNQLSPTTSKLVLVNIGGVIRTAAPGIVSSFQGDARDSLQQALSQLAETCNQTLVELSTEEELNEFSSRTQIINLPPVSSIIGPATEISRIIHQTKAQAEAKRRQEERPATIKKTSQAPVIDGKAENLWSNAKKYEISNVIYSPATSDEDLSAYYKAMWDTENLYLIVDVTDDVLKNDSEDYYQDDAIEVFIDPDNSKSNSYDKNDGQYHFDWDKTNPSMGQFQHGNTAGIEFAIVTTDKGYCAEIKFPWSALGAKPAAGVKIGLDVHVNDDDDGGDRDSKLTWRDKQDNAWQNPSVFGTAELAGLIGWWKLDESEGSTAVDSSGNGNNGTLQGDPAWRPDDGKIGGALELDGEDDYVEIEKESSFDIAGQITLSAWVKTNDAGNGENNPYVAKGDHSYAIKQYEDNSIEFFIYDGNWYAVRHPVDSSFNGLWHHLAGAYDGNQLRLYVDGLQQGTTDHTGSIGTGDFAVNIGRNSEHTDRFYDGLIDDVRIYNYALSEDEIVSLSKGK